jgi:hypothetical protein
LTTDPGASNIKTMKHQTNITNEMKVRIIMKMMEAT